MLRPQEASKPSIMLVDDTPANLKLLEEMLRERSYRVRSFPRGRLALSAAASDPPDLILLDINMPEMNGFEVCKRLKADPELARIPVIFISALNETLDKVTAFRCGGVDYVTKPFQFEEVKARVDTHLELRRLQRELEQHNEHLEELVRLRAGQLTEAHARLSILDRAKSDFLSLISHELRTPLNGLFGVTDEVFGVSPPHPEMDELRELFELSRTRLLAILEDALLLTQIEVEGGTFVPKAIPLAAILRSAMAGVGSFAKASHVILSSVPDSQAYVLGQEELLVKALGRLLETAVKFSGPGETVRLLCQPVGVLARLVIFAKGRIIPAEAIARFFEVFSIAKPITPGGDLGLGPPVAERIMALFGGSVSVENQAPPGIRLQVELKTSEPDTP